MTRGHPLEIERRTRLGAMAPLAVPLRAPLAVPLAVPLRALLAVLLAAPLRALLRALLAVPLRALLAVLLAAPLRALLAALLVLGCSASPPPLSGAPADGRYACETRSARAVESHFAWRVHRPDGTPMPTVNLAPGEQLCLTATARDGRLTELGVVASAPASAPSVLVRLAETDHGATLIVANRLPRPLRFGAMVGKDGKRFPATSCPVAAGRLGVQSWDSVDEVAVFAPTLLGRSAPLRCGVQGFEIRRTAHASRVWSLVEQLD